jgi:hypothetical protein
MKHSRFQVGRYGWQRDLPDTLLCLFASLFPAAQTLFGDEMVAVRGKINPL